MAVIYFFFQAQFFRSDQSDHCIFLLVAQTHAATEYKTSKTVTCDAQYTAGCRSRSVCILRCGPASRCSTESWNTDQSFDSRISFLYVFTKHTHTSGGSDPWNLGLCHVLPHVDVQWSSDLNIWKSYKEAAWKFVTPDVWMIAESFPITFFRNLPYLWFAFSPPSGRNKAAIADTRLLLRQAEELGVQPLFLLTLRWLPGTPQSWTRTLYSSEFWQFFFLKLFQRWKGNQQQDTAAELRQKTLI